MLSLIKKILIGLLTVLVNASNHTKCVSLSNQNVLFNLNNAVKNFTTIHLQLNWMVVFEVVIL